MIINSHVHLIQTEMILNNQKLLSMIRQIPSFKEIDKIKDHINLDSLIKQMDDALIDISILYGSTSPILFSSNEFIADVCKKHPKRFIGFASVDPKDPSSPDILQKAVEELGLKGLKLHPPLQDFYPNDKGLWPLYQRAQSLNIPVVFHVGSTPFGPLVKLDQADPLLLDQVACAFPSLKIVLTHLGTMWHYNAFMVVEKNPNVYIDTAAYPHEIRELMNNNLIERLGPAKFLFGTDFPMPYEGGIHVMKDFVGCIESLGIKPEYKDMIFSKNILNLIEK